MTGPGYRERRPEPALRDRVECYWFFRGPARPVGPPRRILPDGCMDLLLDLGRHAPARGGPPATVVGTMTRALLVPSHPSADLVGVRFRPGGALRFLRTPATELVDRRVEAEELWKGSGDLAGRLAETGDETVRAAVLDRFLRDRLAADADVVPDGVVLRAAGRLSGAEPPSVGAVAEALGVSRRHLERRFHEAVGVTPGTLRRVGRLRRAAELLDEANPADGTPADLARVAARAGYHDQPHLTRDFRAMAGITPGAWRAERAARRVGRRARACRIRTRRGASPAGTFHP